MVTEPIVHTFFHDHQEVNQQNVIHFKLNGNQKRQTMKKDVKKSQVSLLIERNCSSNL